MKLISDRLLRQCNGLMIYNKIERVLVITKWIFNYYNTNFSLEITSKVQNVSQKYTFTHKLTTKRNFQMSSLFFLAQTSRNGTHRIVGYFTISKDIAAEHFWEMHRLTEVISLSLSLSLSHNLVINCISLLSTAQASVTRSKITFWN